MYPSSILCAFFSIRSYYKAPLPFLSGNSFVNADQALKNTWLHSAFSITCKLHFQYMQLRDLLNSAVENKHFQQTAGMQVLRCIAHIGGKRKISSSSKCSLRVKFPFKVTEMWPLLCMVPCLESSHCVQHWRVTFTAPWLLLNVSTRHCTTVPEEKGHRDSLDVSPCTSVCITNWLDRQPVTRHLWMTVPKRILC